MSKPAAKGTARKSKKPSPIKEAAVRWLVFGASGAFLSVPIWINIESAQNKGFASAAGGVGFVVFAAMCAEVAFNGARQRRWLQTLIGIMLCLPFVWLNGLNAIGNLSSNSDQSRDAASAKIQAATDLNKRREEAQKRRNEQARLAGGEASPVSIDAEIRSERAENSRLWQSSFKCDPAWITRQDTRAFCKRLADLEARKAAAEKRDELDVELGRVAAQADIKGAAPSTVDSFADSMTAALKEFGFEVNENTKLSVVRFRDWAFAIGYEIMGTFSYSVLAALFLHKDAPLERPVSRSSARQSLPRLRKPAATGNASPASISEEPGDVEEWFSTCARVAPDKSVRSGAAHKAYAQWCEDSGKVALNLSRFGEAMRDIIFPANPGVGKLVRNKDHFYTGFEIAASASAAATSHAWTPRIVGGAPLSGTLRGPSGTCKIKGPGPGMVP